MARDVHGVLRVYRDGALGSGVRGYLGQIVIEGQYWNGMSIFSLALIQLTLNVCIIMRLLIPIHSMVEIVTAYSLTSFDPVRLFFL